jgi:hypothetical protein
MIPLTDVNISFKESPYSELWQFLQHQVPENNVVFVYDKCLSATSSVTEPEPHHFVRAGAITRCSSGSGSNSSGSNNDIKTWLGIEKEDTSL